MTRTFFPPFRLAALIAMAFLVHLPRAEAGHHPRRMPRLVPTVQPSSRGPSEPLGQFYPSPMLWVGGNYPVGGGYTPSNAPVSQSLAIYGPMSAYRPASAPVLTYVRGYDGLARPTLGTSVSYPNQPGIAPVIYPTRASNFYGFRESGTPPWWDNASLWIDQN